MPEENQHTTWAEARQERIDRLGQEEYDRLLAEVREETRHLTSTWQDVRAEVVRPEDEKVITGLRRQFIAEMETMGGAGVKICDGDCERIRPGFTIHHPPCMMTATEEDE